MDRGTSFAFHCWIMRKISFHAVLQEEWWDCPHGSPHA